MDDPPCHFSERRKSLCGVCALRCHRTIGPRDIKHHVNSILPSATRLIGIVIRKGDVCHNGPRLASNNMLEATRLTLVLLRLLARALA